MRFLYLFLILLLSAAVAVFMFQNAELTTVYFLNASLRLPRSLLFLLVYILGMFTGGFMVGLIRSWLRRSRAPRSHRRS